MQRENCTRPEMAPKILLVGEGHYLSEKIFFPTKKSPSPEMNEEAVAQRDLDHLQLVGGSLL